MANYILRSGNNLLTSGNKILTSSDETEQPVFDINFENLTGYSNGDPVPSIQSQFGSLFYQDTPAKQMTYLENALNGKPALRASGGQYYDAQIAADVKTIMVMVRATAGANGSFGTLFASTNKSFGYFLGGGDAYGTGNQYFETTVNTDNFGNYTLKNRLFLDRVRVDPISGALRSTQFALLTLDIADNFQPNFFRFGSDITPGGGRFFSGDYVRMIGFRNRLTEVKRKTKIEEVLTYYGK